MHRDILALHTGLYSNSCVCCLFASFVAFALVHSFIGVSLSEGPPANRYFEASEGVML